MGHLTTGHSHDDIDQIFGSLALHLVRHCRTAETTSDFVKSIDQFCKGARRPHEKTRVVCQIDRHRDWTFGVGSAALMGQCFFDNIQTNHSRCKLYIKS